MSQIVVADKTNAGHTTAVNFADPTDNDDEWHGHPSPGSNVKPGYFLADALLDFAFEERGNLLYFFSNCKNLDCMKLIFGVPYIHFFTNAARLSPF